MFEVIAFDADDTLWHNESIFTMTQIKFCEMLSSHGQEVVDQTLFSTQIKNLQHFGYGIKGFILSMIETSIELTDGEVSGHEIQQILDFGREMLAAPIELLPYVREVVEELSQKYTLMLITKGDLIDQETKIARSGLAEFFDAVEIVSDKTTEVYSKILERHKIESSRFMMIGNSMRSDIVPIVQIGAHAVH
ncbi:MAG: HAD hydrolase-like protein, partial [SAR324 cluster bacterium]|nr:HAD hydrolase-like protein [SAR324 cluster bacterium]